MNSMTLTNKTIFITGIAGFIGAKLALELLYKQYPTNIIGIDNLNDYYDPSIKSGASRKLKKPSKLIRNLCMHL